VKCKYIFPIKGDVKFPHTVRFEKGNQTFEFRSHKGFITDLFVTISNFPDSALPSITQLKDGKIKASILIPPDPFWEDLVSDVRTMEGALCIWGVREINVDNSTVEWIPETDLEKETLQMFSFSTSRSAQSPDRIPQAHMDLIIRSVLAVPDLRDLEIPMNFYRRGRLDALEDRFIDAIYDLYFVLETLYGNGKFKKAQIHSEFCSSSEMMSGLDHIRKDIDPRIQSHPDLLAEFTQNFLKKTNEQIVEHLIDVRGFLHHHTLSRKGIWHPAMQRKYEVDAVVLLSLCHHILSTKVIGVLFKENRMKEFAGTLVLADDGRRINWTGYERF